MCKIDPVTNQPLRLTGSDNLMEINTIDLRKLVKCKEVYINGKKLDIIGITWLKLFGVKQWCKQSGANKVDFMIHYPENEIDKNIEEVIQILSCLDQKTYDEMRLVIKNAEDTIKTAQKAAEAKGRAEGKAEGKAEGLAEGIDKGIVKGIQLTKMELLKSMSEDGYSKDQIAKLLKLSVKEVEAMLININTAE